VGGPLEINGDEGIMNLVGPITPATINLNGELRHKYGPKNVSIQGSISPLGDLLINGRIIDIGGYGYEKIDLVVLQGKILNSDAARLSGHIALDGLSTPIAILAITEPNGDVRVHVRIGPDAEAQIEQIFAQERTGLLLRALGGILLGISQQALGNGTAEGPGGPGGPGGPPKGNAPLIYDAAASGAPIGSNSSSSYTRLEFMPRPISASNQPRRQVGRANRRN